MTSNVADLPHIKLSHWLKNMSTEHMMVANRAKMTICEILHCIEISNLKNIPMDYVLEKMSVFKETAAHMLYKEDFSIA